MSIADDAWKFCSMFEAEILLELMLRHWGHPLAANHSFRNDFLERSAEALDLARSGEQLIAELPAGETNFVAAMWYVEWSALQSPLGQSRNEELRLRADWLDTVRRSLPSCFVDVAELH